MKSGTNILLAQINPILGDIAGNRDKILRVWADGDAGTDLIVFSELVLSGYPPEDLVLKPDFQAAINVALGEIVAKSHDFTAAVLIGAPHHDGTHLYNAVHLIEKGKILATQYKHHLPNYGVFDEKRVFSAGEMPAPIDWRGHRLGLMICEDMWHADVAAHLKALGADCLIVPNGSPFELEKHATRTDIAAARARENTLPLYYVNQVGGQDELVFDGGSFIMDADGVITAQAPFFEEYILTAEHANTSDKPQTEKQPAPENLIYSALKLGLSDYVAKNRFPGVLIGLSGGIDSAITAVIAAEALGAENVHCVMMPSRYTAQESLDDAAQLADNLGVRYDIIPIEPAVESLNIAALSALHTPPPQGKNAHASTSAIPPVTFENIQSRARGVILMALSNATGKMVLSTGNKSEMAVGYATLYGDMCGGYNILKDLYKTQVYALSRWRNAQNIAQVYAPVIPENILTRAPTAELRADQTDQDSLPPYDILDGILMELIEYESKISDIVAKGYRIETVQRVWRMLDIAEYKRRQAAPGVKITSRAFGRDRRYPITNGFRG